MAKIKELLTDREKLAKYDELTEWKERFTQEFTRKTLALRSYAYCPRTPDDINGGYIYYDIPGSITEIIVSALEAEIKKLEE